MALNKYYSTGTVSVANGATVVTGVGTAWAGTIESDDYFRKAGFAVRIASVDSNTQITLAEGWPGTTLIGATYEISITGDGPERQLKMREIAEQLSAIEANSRGLFYLFDTAITDADPGAGKFRFNNATISSATACYIDNLDANAADVSGEIDTWDDGTSSVKGKLWVRSVEHPEVFCSFNVTGSVVNGTGYHKLTLNYVGGSGTLNATDEIMVSFAPKGDAGQAGLAGITLIYDTATVDADPGAGKFRLNNATPASATAIYVDNVEGLAGADITALIDAWDDGAGSVKGSLTLSNVADPTIFRTYNVIGSVIDGTGYRKLTVVNVTGAGTFVNAAQFRLSFISAASQGGITLAFDSGTTDADPGNGRFKLNNATPALAAMAYIDNLEALSGASITAWLDSFDDAVATRKGTLIFSDASDPTIFRAYDVTGSVVDGTGYRKVTIAHVAGNGSFTADRRFVLMFMPGGSDGYSHGYRLSFDTATTDADPGNGKVRFNSAIFASVTFLYVDNQDANAVSLTTWLDGLDDNVNANARAYLRFENATNPAVYAELAVTGAVIDGTGYRKVPVSPIAGAIPANATVLVASAAKSGRDGNAGVDGTGLFSRVRVVATTNVAIASGLASGTVIDGVTLATNDLVLLTGQTAPAENGIYVVPSVGAASRATGYTTYDAHPGVYVSVMEGTTYADTLWRCTSDKGGTLGTTALAFEKFRNGIDAFSKADPYAVAWSKTGAGTVSIKAGTIVEVAGRIYVFAAATAVTMPALTAGTDYFIWINPNGTLQATTSFVAAPMIGARRLGGFHYAPGGNAAAQTGGDTTPAINEYSLWDLKFRPNCAEPFGMALVAGDFWCDIYKLGVSHIVDGTSKYNVTIADGSSPPKIPLLFGGNGTTAYTTLNWWEAAEVMQSHGKRLLSVADFQAAMYGTTEATSGGTDPVSTILRAASTSKWGMMLSTGNLYDWGADFGGPYGTAAWTTNGRGSTYNLSDAVLLGGAWGSGADSGSRASLWFSLPSNSLADVGARGRCDHLNHV